MDFHSLSRRELQALCKRNKIPANMTNVAMADALKALETVKGLEEILAELSNPPQSPAGPVKESPQVARTATRTTRKKATKENQNVNVLPSPAAYASRRRAVTSVARKSELECTMEHTDSKNVVSGALETPAGSSTRRRAVAPSSRKKAQESSVQPAYSTRRSVRLLEKSMGELSLKGKGTLESVKLNEAEKEMAAEEEKNGPAVPIGRNLSDTMEKEWNFEDVKKNDKSTDNGPDYSPTKAVSSKKPINLNDVPDLKATNDLLNSSVGEKMAKAAENEKGCDEFVVNEIFEINDVEELKNETVPCVSVSLEWDDLSVQDHVSAAGPEVSQETGNLVPHEVPASLVEDKNTEPLAEKLSEPEEEDFSDKKPSEPEKEGYCDEAKEHESEKASDQDDRAKESDLPEIKDLGHEAKDQENKEVADEYHAHEAKDQENKKVADQDHGAEESEFVLDNKELAMEEANKNVTKDDDQQPSDEESSDNLESETDSTCLDSDDDQLDESTVHSCETDEEDPMEEYVTEALVDVDLTESGEGDSKLDDSTKSESEVKTDALVDVNVEEDPAEESKTDASVAGDVIESGDGDLKLDESNKAEIETERESEESDIDSGTEVDSDEDELVESSLRSSETVVEDPSQESETETESEESDIDSGTEVDSDEDELVESSLKSSETVVEDSSQEYNTGAMVKNVNVIESGEGDPKPNNESNKSMTEAEAAVDDDNAVSPRNASPLTTVVSGVNVSSPLAQESISGQFPRPAFSNPGRSSGKKQKPPLKVTFVVENNKENIDGGGRKMESKNDDKVMKKQKKVLDEKSLNDFSMRQLTKMVRELEIKNKSRTALQVLPENQIEEKN